LRARKATFHEKKVRQGGTEAWPEDLGGKKKKLAGGAVLFSLALKKRRKFCGAGALAQTARKNDTGRSRRKGFPSSAAPRKERKGGNIAGSSSGVRRPERG